MGYSPIFFNQKTTLKNKCVNGECLASAFDNIYFNSKIKNLNSGIITFYKSFNSLKEARKISDHIPIWMVFSIN